MNRKDDASWIKEFSEFSKENVECATVPEELSRKIKSALFPNPWKLFTKIASLHAVVAFSSLSICTQFGLNPFQTSYSLTDFFMKTAGHNFCMFACGVFFVAVTYILANLVVTLEELETIKKYEWLQTGTLSLLSVAGFYFFGAELVGTFVGLWLLGAFLGGYISVLGSYKLRQQFA